MVTGWGAAADCHGKDRPHGEGGEGRGGGAPDPGN